MTPPTLRIWIVYYSPSDFPGKYVVRIQEVRHDVPGIIRCREVWVRDTLTEARACIPPGLYRFERSAGDPPQIIETWL